MEEKLNPDEERLLEKGLLYLTACANAKKTVSYKDFYTELGEGTLINHSLGDKILARISENTLDEHDFMLSAIVVNADNNPGEGFYKLAVKNNILDENATSEDKLEFWTGQIQEAFNHSSI